MAALLPLDPSSRGRGAFPAHVNQPRGAAGCQWNDYDARIVRTCSKVVFPLPAMPRNRHVVGLRGCDGASVSELIATVAALALCSQLRCVRLFSGPNDDSRPSSTTAASDAVHVRRSSRTNAARAPCTCVSMFWTRALLRLVQLLALSALFVASPATPTQLASWSVDLALLGNSLTYSHGDLLGWIAANENLQHRFGPFSVHLASGPTCAAVADQECHTIHAHFTKSQPQLHQQDTMLDVHTSTHIMQLFCRWIEQCVTIEMFERLDRPFLVSCQPTTTAPYPSPPSQQNDVASGRRLSDSCPRNLSPSARLACCLTPHSAADVRNLTAIRST